MIRTLLFAISFLTPAIAQADALQQQVLAAAKQVGPRDFSFTQTVRADLPGKPARSFVQRYDPRVQPGWSLVSIDGRAPTAKESAESVKRAGGAPVPSYGRITEWFGAPATRVAETPTSVTYRFARLPKGAVKIGSADLSDKLTAEAVVNTAGRAPFVERARFTAIAPFKMFVVAKVDRFEAVATYRQPGDGKPVPETTTSSFAGTIMGKAQTLNTRTTYSGFKPAS